MAITAKDVMTLRKKSGLGMMECKAALEEAGGDMTAAEQLLRQKGLSKMDGRADRESAEGRIAAALADDASKGAIVAVNTETDFTAGNEQFINMAAKVAKLALGQDAGDVRKTDDIQAAIDEVRLTTKENAQFAKGTVLGGNGSKVGAYVHHNGKVGALVQVQGDVDEQLLRDLCMHVVSIVPAPLGVTADEVPADIVAKEREMAKQQAIESGKPEEIAEKMVEGKMRKFYEETALIKQKFVKDDKQSIEQILPKGATITHFVKLSLGG
jgi:elongation factor Ts